MLFLAKLDLAYLREESEENRSSIMNAFDRLVLPDGHKEMVKSLVTQHFRDKRGRGKSANSKTDTDVKIELIQGKGTQYPLIHCRLTRYYSLED